MLVFQSTSPVRGTTSLCRIDTPAFMISIHVPREGDDAAIFSPSAKSPVFQSTSPVRGTTMDATTAYQEALFQSTSPVRGTTGGRCDHRFGGTISIHVPREGDDLQLIAQLIKRAISIHVPREGDDLLPAGGGAAGGDFNPRPP